MKIGRFSDHVSEIGLLGLLGTGVLAVLIISAFQGKLTGRSGVDVAAFLLVLQRIVEAVQKRWEQRGTDKLGELAAGGTPPRPTEPTELTLPEEVK